jgi:Cu/Ag efflux protein CusF
MKKTILLLALITLVAFVSGVMAQGKPATTPAPAAPASTKPAPPAQLEKFSGKIKSMDAMAKSIVVAEGKTEKTFVIVESTKITKGKDTVALADLKAGLNVAIEAKKEGDKLIASTIKVSVPEAAPVKK